MRGVDLSNVQASNQSNQLWKEEEYRMRPDDTDDMGTVDPGADANDFQAPPEEGAQSNGSSGSLGAAGDHDLVMVPRSTADFLKRQEDMLGEMIAWQQDPQSWELVKPSLDNLARGEYPEGSRDWERKNMVFIVRAEAKKNGHRLLAKANAKDLSRTFTHALKHNTGLSLSELIEQGKQRAIEHKKAAE